MKKSTKLILFFTKFCLLTLSMMLSLSHGSDLVKDEIKKELASENALDKQSPEEEKELAPEYVLNEKNLNKILNEEKELSSENILDKQNPNEEKELTPEYVLNEKELTPEYVLNEKELTPEYVLNEKNLNKILNEEKELSSENILDKQNPNEEKELSSENILDKQSLNEEKLVDVNRESNWTPLRRSFESGDMETTLLLLKNGAEVQPDFVEYSKNKANDIKQISNLLEVVDFLENEKRKTRSCKQVFEDIGYRFMSLLYMFY